MAISKVVYDGNTLIDLTSDSVNASNLSKGTTAHNAAGEQIVGTFEQVQSDWNQNDETAVDYVKNRPFYTGNPVETVLVEESTLTFMEVDNGIYATEIPPTFLAAAGKTYTVYWDSTSYECTCVDIGFPALGNLSIAFDGSDTGEPFVILTGNEYIVIYTSDTSASHTFSISKVAPEVVKVDTKYLPFMPKPRGKSYLTFSSQNIFSLETSGNIKTWNGTLEYFSSDNTWAVWEGTGALSAVTNGAEYVLYLRGIGNTVITGNQYPFKFLGSDIACIGNIETLLDYVTVEAGEHPAMATYCYEYMFSGCSSLIQAPELPATTLADNCYEYMFYKCSSLIQAPELPATTLAFRCYKDMFSSCTSLKLSETKTEEYIQEYRIPSSGDGTTSLDSLDRMFYSTGGTFTGTPNINTTYYLSSDNMITRGTEIATLNGYVKNMIGTSVEIPKTLPNPNAITFTGAVTGVYDGSTPMSVNIPTVPTKTSQLTNDSGFLTSHQDISGKQDKSTLEADVAAKGFTKNTGTYSKPAGGIPKGDLAAAVQTSLDKADSALQSVPSTYRTAAMQNMIDAGKQDRLIAGENITIASDGKTISATGGGAETLFVTITDNNGTLSADKSYNDILNAIVAGITVLVNYAGMVLPLVGIADALYFGIFQCDSGDASNGAVVATVMIEITQNGEVNDISVQIDIPTVPTKTSQLTNDSGYLTLATLPKYGGESE